MSSVPVSLTGRIETPAPADLNAAIEKKVKAGKTNPADIAAALKKENVKWKLPNQRVAKFVKAQKDGKPILTTQDELNFKSGSGWFTIGKPPPKREPKAIVVAKPVVKKEETPTVATQESAPPESAMSVKEVVYADDNNGQKEGGCWCFGQ